MSLCHKLWFSNHYIFGTKCCRYFKLWILLDQIIWVWNIKGLQHRVLKILKFKYLILFQRLNFFKNLVTNKIPDKNYMKLESSQELKKKLSVYHKLKRSNLYFFSMSWRKPLVMGSHIFHSWNIWSLRHGIAKI